MPRIRSLDGLRGVAVLLVVAFNYINNQLLDSPGLFVHFISRVTYYGWVGVDLFFVLSGFLIGGIVFGNLRRKNFFLYFYTRRFLRIIPNYYLLLTFFLLLRDSGQFDSNIFLVGHDVVPTWSYFAMVHNLFMAKNGMGNASLSVSWSIGIEEQFYIIFPFIAFILPRKALLFFLVGCVLSAPLFRYLAGHYPANYVLPQCRIDGLAFGVIGAWLVFHFDIKAWIATHINGLYVVLVIVMVVSGVIYYKYGDLLVFKHTLFSMLFFILLILSVEGGNLIARSLCNPMLVWFGKISYPLYLFHYVILGFIHHAFGNITYIGIHDIMDVIITLIAFIASVIVSWGIYFIVEVPLLNWGRRYSFS
jgi:peptidoglycan/LPS O-acetylase OafA/YrhL